MNVKNLSRIVTLSAVLAVSSLSAGNSDETREHETRPPDTSIARVLECSAPIEINRSDDPAVHTGTRLTQQDTLYVPAEAQVTLLFQDGRVVQFEGPTTIGLQSGSTGDSKGLLTKLAGSLRELLFSSANAGQDVQLGVRDVGLTSQESLTVPRLILPIPNTSLKEAPGQLRWQPVEGVFLYSVSLFDSNQLLWQGTTRNNFVDIATTDLNLAPGAEYTWTVEAVVGNSSLRSQPATFSILSQRLVAQLNNVLADIDNMSLDGKLAARLKLIALSDFNLKDACFAQVQEISRSDPGDYAARMMKAKLLEDMGLYDRAAEIYKALLFK